jgi:hypothetical protein
MMYQGNAMTTPRVDLNEIPSLTKSLNTAAPRSGVGVSDLLAFLSGLSSMLYINLGGNLYLAEIFLLSLLPYLVFKQKALLKLGYFKAIIFLGCGWFLSQIITDLYRGTDAADILKGWSLITIFLTNFVAVYLLLFHSLRRITLGLLGFAIGTMLQPVLQPTANMLIDPWKFGFGPALALLFTVTAALWGSAKTRNIIWWIIAMSIIAAFSFYVRSRSTGGIVLLTALAVWFRFTRLGWFFSFRLNNLVSRILGIVFVSTAILVIICSYGYMAEQGYFGEQSRQANRQQSSGVFGVFLGARSEWWPAMHALMDSPIIGYGSYGKNTEYGVYLYDLINMGYGTDVSQFDTYLLLTQNAIPTHSHFLQGWVWAGLAGGVFWLFVFGLIVHALFMAYHRPTILLSATLFLGFSGLWDILFSPLSNIGRLHWAFILVTMLYALARKPALNCLSDARVSQAGVP